MRESKRSLEKNLRRASDRLEWLSDRINFLNDAIERLLINCLSEGQIQIARTLGRIILPQIDLGEGLRIIKSFVGVMLNRIDFFDTTNTEECVDKIVICASGLIWASQILQNDVTELKSISEILENKFGQEFANDSRASVRNCIIESKLIKYLAMREPSILIVEG